MRVFNVLTTFLVQPTSRHNTKRVVHQNGW
jgi:hypothetical protein